MVKETSEAVHRRRAVDVEHKLADIRAAAELVRGRDLHSSTLQLDPSCFYP